MLHDYLNKVSELNLDLKIDQAKAETASAKAIGLSIPPPMLSLIQMRPEQGDTANGFEISQSLPFPTKLSGNYSARDFEARSQEENRLSSRKQLLANSRLLYFSLWQNQQKIELLEEKKHILQDHIRLTKSTTRSDSFTATHLLKAESDLDFIDNETEVIRQSIREKQVQLALLISEDPAIFKLVAIEPEVSTVPELKSVEDSHQFRYLNYNFESKKAQETEIKSSWLPDFNLKYKEVGATSMSNRYNEVMVGITLPFIFFWEPYAAGKQANRARLAAEYELENQRRNFNSAKVTLQSRVESLKKQLDVFNNKLIPRAEKQIKLLRYLAPRDMATLQEHRETLEALPELKIKILEIRLKYEEAVAELEKYTPNRDL